MSSRLIAVLTLIALVVAIFLGSGLLPPDAPVIQSR
jgi:hypothetical protein